MKQVAPACERYTPFEDALRMFDSSVARAFVPDQVVCSPTASPSWAASLGVTLPCTLQDLKRAFRRMALQTHPDCPGGSHEAFLRTQAIFEDALHAFEHPQPVQESCPSVYASQRYGRADASSTSRSSPSARTVRAYA